MQALPHSPGAGVAEALAEAQARLPSVPVVLCETRPLAQEWTYRWLGACLAERGAARAIETVEGSCAPGPADAGPARVVRRNPGLARTQGIDVSDRGRIPADLLRRFPQSAG